MVGDFLALRPPKKRPMALKNGFSGVPRSTEGIYEGPMTIGDMLKIDVLRLKIRCQGPIRIRSSDYTVQYTIGFDHCLPGRATLVTRLAA